MTEANSQKTASPQLPRLNPAAIAVGDLARMLALPAEVVRGHIEEGSPVNADGTVNLVHYAAWLNLAPPPPPAPEAEQTA